MSNKKTIKCELCWNLFSKGKIKRRPMALIETSSAHAFFTGIKQVWMCNCADVPDNKFIANQYNKLMNYIGDKQKLSAFLRMLEESKKNGSKP